MKRIALAAAAILLGSPLAYADPAPISWTYTFDTDGNSVATYRGRIVGQQSFRLTSVLTAALPTCDSAGKFLSYYVRDATAPTYGGTLTGGGTVIALAICDGTNWTTH